MLDKTPGKISWVDLTIPDAEAVRTFYEAVAGWTSDPVSMGDYCFVTLAIQGGPGKRGQVPKTGTARRVLCFFGT
jgi:predicted enzyme related to lactoylglutathione lyase